MAGNINIPQDLTKVLKVEVTDTSDTLRRFLTDLLIRIEELEATVISLQTQIDELP